MPSPDPTADGDWIVPDWDVTGVGALMSTRRGGVGEGAFASFNLRDGLGDAPQVVAANRQIFATTIGAQPVWLEQVHGAQVVRVGAADVGGLPTRADASVTTEPGIACCIQVADCMPVLFAAPGGRGVAAAHAGWRGLAAGVLARTVQALSEASGCAPIELRAWIGPCIGPDHFEVGADVLAAFGARPDAPAPHFRARPGHPGKWLADLPGLAREALRGAGVTSVGGGTWCTVADASRFFSFRRDRVTGRMAGAVWIERRQRG